MSKWRSASPFLVVIICYVQIFSVLIGRFSSSVALAWVLPVAAAFLSRGRLQPSLIYGRAGLTTVSLCLIAALGLWFVPGLSPYLPYPGFSMGMGVLYSMTLSLPAAILAFTLLWYWDDCAPASKLDELPKSLKLGPLAFGTAGFVILSGLILTLPVGPLSDEGMILFMEGGCDWGASNVFFFSRLGLIAAMNFALVVVLGRGSPPFIRFVPHLIVAGVLISQTYRDVSCDDYWYGHPQGNLGQTLVEIVAFALLGIALGKLAYSWKSSQKLMVLVAWNALFVAIFYAALSQAPHWDWTHTFVVSGSLLVVAALVALRQFSADGGKSRVA